jgi:hypothetical protein
VTRPKGYSASIRQDHELWGTHQTKGMWPNGTMKWTVVLKNPAGKTLTFKYHTGPAVTEKPTFDDVVNAIITDGLFYEDYPTLEEFASETGDEPHEARRAYEACKSMSERTRAFFGDDFDAICEATA